MGSPTKLRVDGWMARIFQHEIDHLNGVLFTDRATRVWKLVDPRLPRKSVQPHPAVDEGESTAAS